MTVLIVPGAVGNTSSQREWFHSAFAHGCSADVQSCVPTGALNVLALNAATPAATQAEAQAAAPAVAQSRLSGAAWVAEFPTSTSTEDLTAGFRDAVNSFIAAINAAGGSVSISATYRPLERAYLMHYAWDIAKGTIQPDKVPAYTGVDIEWDHGDKTKSVNAAKAMVSAYGIVHRPSLTTNHAGRTAIDMNINGMIGKTIVDGASKKVTIKKASDLHTVGASYGVHKLVSDPPHWSADGH
ncbi:hypothetical protein [Diaphorobacter caeni]|uniref:hypothetical protein n=1 Tax=Diaphorobacter caeni TaxID=2784387 RepID=UPI001E5A5D15|nr:hypothetical protein [Diaphorobacter caeni]